jgi:hypothetical protein
MAGGCREIRETGGKEMQIIESVCQHLALPLCGRADGPSPVSFVQLVRDISSGEKGSQSTT